MQFEAVYHDGMSSASQNVRVDVSEQGEVTLLPSASSPSFTDVSYQWRDLVIQPRIAQTPRWIQLPNGAQLESVDNDSIDRIQKHFNHGVLYQLIHLFEQSWIAVLFGIFVLVGFLWATVQFGIPAAANLASKAVPEEVLFPLGDEVVIWMDDNLFEPSSLSLERQKQLKMQFDLYFNQRQKYQLLFRASPKIGANALALPNDTIILTDELVELAGNDLQIVAVLAHEVGHLESRHAIRRLLQQAGIAAILMVFTGDVSSVSSAIAYLPALLIELGYSREFEHEADEFALEFMSDNEIAVDELAKILLSLHQHHQSSAVESPENTGDEEDSMSFDYLSTHPGVDERIKRINSFSR